MPRTKEQDAEYQRKRYAEKGRKHQTTQKAGRYEERKVWLDTLKEGPCVDCGIKFPPEAMSFDHVNGDKISGISKMIISYAKEKIIEEIAKCELVCLNCHAVRSKKLWKEHHPNKPFR